MCLQRYFTIINVRIKEPFEIFDWRLEKLFKTKLNVLDQRRMIMFQFF